jgi:hypothetical protein
MNSFQIKQAKADLVRIVREQPDQTLSVADAVEMLRGAGHRVSEDVLRVLVEGSAQPVLAFTDDRLQIAATSTP